MKDSTQQDGAFPHGFIYFEGKLDKSDFENARNFCFACRLRNSFNISADKSDVVITNRLNAQDCKKNIIVMQLCYPFHERKKSKKEERL